MSPNGKALRTFPSSKDPRLPPSRRFKEQHLVGADARELDMAKESAQIDIAPPKKKADIIGYII
jgi:hypothetical protein